VDVIFAGTGIRLAQAGYAVFGLDVEGHGKSDGLQAYIPSFNNIVDDTISYFKSVRGLFIHLLNPYPPTPSQWTKPVGNFGNFGNSVVNVDELTELS
jgi:hypothetical protein